MSDREIERQIRSKELQIERLEAEIREAKGYLGRAREGGGDWRPFKTSSIPAHASPR